MRYRICAGLIGLGMFAAASGCAQRVEETVVLYSTVDQEISAPILAAFHRSENKAIQPRATFADAEAEREQLLDGIRNNDAADVLWTDDILLMVELQRQGALRSHAWKVPADFPADMRATDGSWCGFAATARVLMISTDKMPEPEAHPKSVAELADSRWQQRCAIARPLSGTAAIHAATIAHAQGLDAAEEWFARVASNAIVLPSNAAVAAAVAAGRVDWGLTDSSYAVVYRDQSASIAIVFPDQETSQPGTLRIPNAAAILSRSPHPVAAARLADYLIHPGTADRLAMSDAAQIPLSSQSAYRPRVLPASPVRWATVDFESAQLAWKEVEPQLRKIFAAGP